jgi:hypothetical protein
MRDAILSAADRIERYPGCLDWSQGINPYLWNQHCTSGCPLAWIGFFEDNCSRDYRDAASRMGITPYMFYREMDSFLPGYQRWEWWAIPKEERHMPLSPWSYDNKVCADCLRKFADKFFPVRHEGLPEAVREIFNVEEAQCATQY